MRTCTHFTHFMYNGRRGRENTNEQDTSLRSETGCVSLGYVQLDAPMRNSSRYEGETLRIRCEITGFPLPRYIWLKDGRAVDELPPSTSRRFSAKTTPWGSRCVNCDTIIIAHLSEQVHYPVLTYKNGHCREFLKLYISLTVTFESHFLCVNWFII